MMKQKANVKKIALVSALCFAVRALTDLFSSIRYIQANPGPDVMAVVLEWLSYIGLSVTVLLRNRKCALIAAGVHFLAVLAFFLINLDPAWIDWRRVFYLAAYALLAILIVHSEKNHNLIRKIWFLPGILFLLECVEEFVYPHILSSLTEWNLLDYLTVLSETTALFCAGLWLKNDQLPDGNR